MRGDESTRRWRSSARLGAVAAVAAIVPIGIIAPSTTSAAGGPGYGTIASGAAKTDTDKDGMPDAGETKYGLNPSSNDAGGDFDGTGYTNVEKYLNGLLDAQYP